jgi:glyoxylase-like metal-dependent hydrolase (beta-lactamase superfamily II)
MGSTGGGLSVDVYTSPLVALPAGGYFSPTTSALVTGPTEALLVDTQYRAQAVDDIIEIIDASGRKLVAIFVTHGHFDHYFGLQRLLARYPDARPVALPAIADAIRNRLDSERARWRSAFGDDILDNEVIPASLNDASISIDGHMVRAIEVPQADISPASILHIPPLDTVVAGDAIYNGVHAFLGETSPGQWSDWAATVQFISSLSPSRVIAGHKRPELDDGSRCVAETLSYLTAFADGFARSSTARELVTRMQAQFPHHENVSALVLSSVTAFNNRTGPSSPSPHGTYPEELG